MYISRSQTSQDIYNQKIKTLFQNVNLNGFEVAKNTEIATIIKRDSTEFANQIIAHPRGREIISQLVDIALRPSSVAQSITTLNNDIILQEKNGNLPSDEMTATIYNAFEILTNQYEDFVQYVFEDQKKTANILTDSVENNKENTNFPKIDGVSLPQHKPVQGKQQSKQSNNEDLKKQDEQDWDDCVIMQGNFPELTKNQQDSVLRKIGDLSKLNQSQYLKCSILDRMFLIFDQHCPIEQTPVSYFNKIILQFVYQKPEQVMRYIYCDQKTKDNKRSAASCDKIKKIAKHLYNHGSVQLIVHIMQLESDGNFFMQQKIEMLKAVAEQVFKFEQSSKKQQLSTKSFDSISTTSSQLMDQKVRNYVLILKSLSQKLQDKYEQQKYTPILKYHLNDDKILTKIIDYFFLNFNYFYMSGLLAILIQMLKVDFANFKLQKTSNQQTTPFGNNSSLINKSQQSSITSYDLKLSKQILNQIQKVIQKINIKFQQWQGSTMRMVQYYQLLYYWLNITLKQRLQFNRKNIFKVQFFNESLFKIQSHPNSTILHNVIKNIFADFIPKISNPFQIILNPQCQLIPFIENYLIQPEQGVKKKTKCFQNQLYHIGKAVINIWENQHKMLLMYQVQEQNQKTIKEIQNIKNLVEDQQLIRKFQNLKNIIAKKQLSYDHLICGDPRKISEYQEQESSEIIMASSFKNFFKSPFNINTLSQINTETVIDTANDRQLQGDQVKQQNKKQVQNTKNQSVKVTHGKGLKLDQYANSFFQSAISPLNANHSHTFNFDFDALPLDSDGSQDAKSQQQDIPVINVKKTAKNNDDQMKQMQQNFQNFEIVAGSVLIPQNRCLSQTQSFGNVKNLLNLDSFKIQTLSRSIQISDNDSIQKVDSYIVLQSPRKQSQDVVSLGIDSNKQQSRMSDDIKDEKILNMNLQINLDQVKYQTHEQQENLDGQFTKHYSSYLKYDLEELCSEIEDQ